MSSGFMKRGGFCLLVVFFLIVFSFFAHSLSANSLFIKASLAKSDPAFQRSLILSGDPGEEVLLTLDLPGALLSENRVVLDDAGVGKKVINLTFDSSSIDTGVYTGKLLIAGQSEEITIPIVFEAGSKDVLYDSMITVAQQYSNIPVGGTFVAAVKIFDVASPGTNGIGGDIVDVDYVIYDLEGRIMSSESEQVFVNRIAHVTKTLKFPEYIKEGQYVFAVISKYKSSVTSSTSLFRVVPKGELEEDAMRYPLDFSLFIIAGSISLFFIAFTTLFVYLIRDRNKFILLLSRHHAFQMQKFYDIFRKKQDAGHEALKHISHVSEGLKKHVNSMHKNDVGNVGMPFVKSRAEGELAEGVKIRSEKSSVEAIPKEAKGSHKKIFRADEDEPNLDEMGRDFLIWNFLKKMTEMGYSKEQVEKAFLKRGWDKDKIKHYLDAGRSK